jgi:hypothetical protein
MKPIENKLIPTQLYSNQLLKLKTKLRPKSTQPNQLKPNQPNPNHHYQAAAVMIKGTIPEKCFILLRMLDCLQKRPSSKKSGKSSNTNTSSSVNAGISEDTVRSFLAELYGGYETEESSQAQELFRVLFQKTVYAKDGQTAYEQTIDVLSKRAFAEACELHPRETAPLFSWMPVLVRFICGPFPYHDLLKDMENNLDPSSGKAALAENTYFEDREVDWLQREFFDLKKQDAVLQKLAAPRQSRSGTVMAAVPMSNFMTPRKGATPLASGLTVGRGIPTASGEAFLEVDTILDLARLTDRSRAVHEGIDSVAAEMSALLEPPCGSRTLAKVFAPVVSTELLLCLFSSVEITGPKPNVAAPATPLEAKRAMRRQMSHGSKTTMKMNGLQQFMEALSVVCRGTVEEKAKLCFRAFDADDDGFLSLEEITSMLDLVLVEGTPAWQRLARYQALDASSAVVPKVLPEALVCLALEVLYQCSRGTCHCHRKTTKKTTKPEPQPTDGAFSPDGAGAGAVVVGDVLEPIDAALCPSCVFEEEDARASVIFDLDGTPPDTRRKQALEFMTSMDVAYGTLASDAVDDTHHSLDLDEGSSVWKMGPVSFAALFARVRPDLFHFLQDIKAVACTELPIKPSDPTEEAAILRYLWQQFHLPDTTVEGHKRRMSEMGDLGGLELSNSLIMSDGGSGEDVRDVFAGALSNVTSNFGLRSRVFKGLLPSLNTPADRGSHSQSGWYLVPMKWWRSWQQYSNFEETLCRPQAGHMSMRGSRLGAVFKGSSGASMSDGLAGTCDSLEVNPDLSQTRSAGDDKGIILGGARGCVAPPGDASDVNGNDAGGIVEPEVTLEQLGPIPTLSLFCNDNAQNKLRIGLQRGKDFEVVCPEVWRALFSWHGCTGPPVLMLLRPVPPASLEHSLQDSRHQELGDDVQGHQGQGEDLDAHVAEASAVGQLGAGSGSATTPAASVAKAAGGLPVSYELSMHPHVLYKMNNAHDVSIMKPKAAEEERDAEGDDPAATAAGEDVDDPADDVLEIASVQIAKSGGGEDGLEGGPEAEAAGKNVDMNDNTGKSAGDDDDMRHPEIRYYVTRVAFRVRSVYLDDIAKPKGGYGFMGHLSGPNGGTDKTCIQPVTSRQRPRFERRCYYVIPPAGGTAASGQILKYGDPFRLVDSEFRMLCKLPGQIPFTFTGFIGPCDIANIDAKQRKLRMAPSFEEEQVINPCAIFHPLYIACYISSVISHSLYLLYPSVTSDPFRRPRTL